MPPATLSVERKDRVAIVVYAVIAWGLITLVKIATAPKGAKPEV